jgi:hypothetical protein
MNLLGHLLLGFVSAGGNRYNVTGGTYDFAAPSDATVKIRINTDGTIDEAEGTGSPSFSQINAGTDWVIPNSISSSVDHWVRVTRTSGDATDFTMVPGSLGVWEKLGVSGGAAQIFGYTVTTANYREGTYLVEISTDSGGSTVVASGSYTLQADGTP